MNKRMTTLGALLLSATFAATASAQQPGNPGSPNAATSQQHPPMQQQAPMQQPDLPKASEFSNKDLEAFADAQQEMGEIQQKYSDKLMSKKDQPEEAMKVQRDAQKEMVQAVKDSGLELKTYNQIAQLAQYDAEFRARIQEMM